MVAPVITPPAPAALMAGLVEPSLILTGVTLADRGAALRLAARQFQLAGRTRQARAVEAALQQREASGSTGVGEGFAIPHCRTDAMDINSFLLLKPAAPVAWPSPDGRPVRVIAVLALRQTDPAGEHLRLLARFSRLLMNPEFRRRLEVESAPAKLSELLTRELAVSGRAGEIFR